MSATDGFPSGEAVEGAQQGPPGRLSGADFHRALGPSDWRVTSDGPAAVFAADTLALAARLVPAVVASAERFAVAPDVDLRSGAGGSAAVVVRVPDTDWDGIPVAVVDFAVEVSRAATVLGLIADPAQVQSVNVYVAQHSGVDARPFFMAVFGYVPFGDTDAVDPLRARPRMAFNPLRGDVPGRGRTHFDVFVPEDQARSRVDAAIAAGGRLVDDSEAPNWWTLVSPDNHGVDIVAYADRS